VPGSGQNLQAQGGGHGDPVAVGHRNPLEAHLVRGGDQVAGAGQTGQSQSAGDVVVVQVRLGDVGDPDTDASGLVQDPVDAALRVHHYRRSAVVHQIRPVPPRGGLHHHKRTDPWNGWLDG
jgi:hypothetical protein